MDEINAKSAYTRSKGFNNDNKLNYTAEDINYTLTIKRLFETIKNESSKGKRRIAFITPKYVMDGTLTNPIKLAKQIKVKLTRIGYDVDRYDDVLHISWDKEEEEKEQKRLTIKKQKQQQDKIKSLPRNNVYLTKPPINPPRGYSDISSKKNGSISIRRIVNKK